MYSNTCILYLLIQDGSGSGSKRGSFHRSSSRASIAGQVTPLSIAGSSTDSNSSYSVESGNLIRSHSLRLGLYSINLGTKMGQKLHTGHMLTLPMIPIIIILVQCTTDLWASVSNMKEITNLQEQVWFQKFNLKVISKIVKLYDTLPLSFRCYM